MLIASRLDVIGTFAGLFYVVFFNSWPGPEAHLEPKNLGHIHLHFRQLLATENLISKKIAHCSFPELEMSKCRNGGDRDYPGKAIAI